MTPDAITRATIEQDAHVAGYRLAELRGKAGITQAQLAEVMGGSSRWTVKLHQLALIRGEAVNSADRTS